MFSRLVDGFCVVVCYLPRLDKSRYLFGLDAVKVCSIYVEIFSPLVDLVGILPGFCQCRYFALINWLLLGESSYTNE